MSEVLLAWVAPFESQQNRAAENIHSIGAKTIDLAMLSVALARTTGRSLTLTICQKTHAITGLKHQPPHGRDHFLTNHKSL
jgi:hypothetical protein